LSMLSMLSMLQAPLALPYTVAMGKAATLAGSTPYLLVQVFDRNTVSSNVLIGQGTCFFFDVVSLALFLWRCFFDVSLTLFL
jgi:hypothetical protein